MTNWRSWNKRDKKIKKNKLILFKLDSVRSGCPISRARGSCIKRSSIPDRIGIQKCCFLRRGENRSTQRKTSRSREENQQQTQPTYDVESGNRTRATLVEGEYSHHCAIPAPHPIKFEVVRTDSNLSDVFVAVSVVVASAPYRLTAVMSKGPIKARAITRKLFPFWLPETTTAA